MARSGCAVGRVENGVIPFAGPSEVARLPKRAASNRTIGQVAGSTVGADAQNRADNAPAVETTPKPDAQNRALSGARVPLERGNRALL
jgi:hypothetical protein